MHFRQTRLWRRHRRRRAAARLGWPAFGFAFAAACLAPAAACADTSSPILTVAGSSVILVGQPAGRTTVTASRRDPLTGKPVVIGQYSGDADSVLPFTVNTTAPTATLPNGDCWQQGALSSPLTPDLRPGDVVTVTGTPDPLGGAPFSMSTTVPADAKASSGPIPSCADGAPFAQSAITDAPAQVTGGPVTVRGRAQPFATGVSLIATDGRTTTPAASATPAADGTWSATLPEADVAALADGSLTLTPVVAVPDISTGAPAHIAATPATVIKHSPAAAVPSGPSGAAPGTAVAGGGASPTSTGSPAAPGSSAAAGSPGTAALVRRVSGLRAPARISLRTARAHGISASLIAPTGASTVQLQLLRGSRLLQTATVAARPGTRQTVRLSAGTLRRLLAPGRYTLRVRAGAAPDQLGSPLLRSLVVR
jgi:hypothetical protein